MKSGEYKFGDRLLDLMEVKGFSTPKALAVKFYDDKIVKVHSRESTDPFSRRDNAISSIEKKIRVHTRLDKAEKVQGEFILAYCDFFECSADYLLGFTDIKTPNIDVRTICEKTGLCEKAVQKLTESSEENQIYVKCWSKILKSAIYEGLPNNWLEAGKQLVIEAQNNSKRNAAEWEKQYAGGKGLLSLKEDIEGYEERAASAQAAYYGILFNISRNVTNFIEDDLSQSLTHVKKELEKRFMDIVKERHIT